MVCRRRTFRDWGREGLFRPLKINYSQKKLKCIAEEVRFGGWNLVTGRVGRGRRIHIELD